MKRFLIAAFAFSLLAATGTALADNSHRYRVKGTNPDGSAYSGEAEITIISDTTCAIKWITGSTESTGICMRNGDAVAAGYVLGDAVGLVIYKLRNDGSLEGTWTIAGKNGTGTEELTPE
jgi:hypothetical protein